jgi:glycosyltransferase involved in cell wall biosynthesis
MNSRILIFTDNYPYGRSEPFLENELQYIDRSFEKVSILPLQKGRCKNGRREIPEKIKVKSPSFVEIKNKKELLIKGIFNTSLLLSLFREGFDSGIWKSWTKFRIWLTHLLLIRSMLADIRNRNLIQYFNEFDILYFYWGLRWSQIIPFLPEDLKPKIIVRFHGSDLYEHTNKGYIPWRYQQLSKINTAIVISDAGKKYIEDHYPFLKRRILLSRIGTNDYGRNPYTRSDIIRIITCSNLVAVKRVGLIVETLMCVKQQIEWIHFGDGLLRKEIEKLSANLPGNVSWKLPGAVTHDELMNFYKTESVDLFINVSSSEGLPVSIMEALSFGIPVIATNVGGTSEIVSEKNGLLVESDFSPDSLAGKIEELVNKTDFLALRKAARDEWEIKSMAEKVYPGFISHILTV